MCNRLIKRIIAVRTISLLHDHIAESVCLYKSIEEFEEHPVPSNKVFCRQERI